MAQPPNRDRTKTRTYLESLKKVKNTFQKFFSWRFAKFCWFSYHYKNLKGSVAWPVFIRNSPFSDNCKAGICHLYESELFKDGDGTPIVCIGIL